MSLANDDPRSHGTYCVPGHVERSILRVGTAHQHAERDTIAQETPIALEYNGIAHAALLASPTDLPELALGFSFTEGIIDSASELYDLEIVTQPKGLVIQVRIASASMHRLTLRRRMLAGRTGCGLCGIESLDEVERALHPLPPPSTAIRPEAITRALAELSATQALHKLTGATHAAAWANASGQIDVLYEDVGRHNALDKLIGYLLSGIRDYRQGMFVISSRASFEMLQKTHAAGVSALIAISAPTSYAIDLAERSNLLLAGFARGQQFVVYSHPEYLSAHRSMH